MKTLVEICVEQLKKRYLGKVETLQLLDVANELGLSDLRKDCLMSVRFAYDFFRDAADQEYLQELCGNDQVEAMEVARSERVRSKRYLKQEGSVIDREMTAYSDLGTDDLKSGNNKYYPYEALMSGVKWPPGIDPARREDWLSDEDFLKCFGMSRDEFNRQPAFKRTMKKKEILLW